MENLEEIWKPIKGYEGYYDVSNLGRVKSLERVVVRSNGGRILVSECLLKLGLDKQGYFNVKLSKNGVKKTRTIHQLVAIAFLGFTRSGMELVINHKDFNKQNNHIANLEIVSQRQNANKKHIKSSSIYTGVTWHKLQKKWMSQITKKGKCRFLGYFEAEIDASIAYQKKLNEINNAK